MEERRNGVWLAAAALAAAPALACEPALKGTRLESPRYVLSFKIGEVAVSRHFSVEIQTCAKPGNPQPEALKVDAQMPEHRHGMNYAPQVTSLGPGRWRAEGLMFHMPGRWEFTFELDGAGKTDRVSSVYQLN